MGNINSIKQSLHTSHSTVFERNAALISAVSHYMTNSNKFKPNINTSFVVVILVVPVIEDGKLTWHAVFHHHGREDALGFIAGKVDYLDETNKAKGREKPLLAAYRETCEEAGIFMTMPCLSESATVESFESPVELLHTIIQGTTTVYVARTLSSIDLSNWRNMCEVKNNETLDIVSFPLSVVASWEDIQHGVTINGTSYHPRKYSVTTHQTFIIFDI